MSFNLEKYVPVFREESESLLERIEKHIGKFQRTANLEAIHEIKRCIHTIKGSSAAMGLEALSKKSHELEDVVQDLAVGDGKDHKELVRRIFIYIELVRKTIRGDFLGSRGGVFRMTDSDTVKIKVHKLDNILNVVGEVLNLHIQIKERAKSLERSTGLSGEIAELVTRIEDYERYVSQLQNLVMDVRMVPLENILDRFQQFVHNYTLETGKRAELQIRGAGTELDKKLANILIEPLTHLIRNAIDHGIETEEERVEAGKPAKGIVRIAAYQASNQVILEVEDDGRGIDVERIAVALGRDRGTKLDQQEILDWIFREGSSTATRVTQVSGRGIGMGAVRNAIDRMGGSIQVFTRPGRGTLFTIRVPLTLAVIKALVVRVPPHTLAVPLSGVVETLMVPRSKFLSLGSSSLGIRYRETVIPLVNEASLDALGSEVSVVVISDGARTGAFAVDKAIREQDVVIKSIQDDLDLSSMVSGVAILGDGSLAFILNVQHVLSERFVPRELCVA